MKNFDVSVVELNQNTAGCFLSINCYWSRLRRQLFTLFVYQVGEGGRSFREEAAPSSFGAKKKKRPLSAPCLCLHLYINHKEFMSSICLKTTTTTTTTRDSVIVNCWASISGWLIITCNRTAVIIIIIIIIIIIFWREQRRRWCNIINWTVETRIKEYGEKNNGLWPSEIFVFLRFVGFLSAGCLVDFLCFLL